MMVNALKSENQNDKGTTQWRSQQAQEKGKRQWKRKESTANQTVLEPIDKQDKFNSLAIMEAESRKATGNLKAVALRSGEKLVYPIKFNP